MHSKSLVIVFLFILMLPLIAISTNHEIFFIVVSLIVLTSSVRYIFKRSSNDIPEDILTSEEIEEELEELIDIDIKKLGVGLSISYNLITILFLFYCAFFFVSILLRGLAALAILFQIFFIIKKTSKQEPAADTSQYSLQGILSSFLNIAVIIFTVINKLYRLG